MTDLAEIHKLIDRQFPLPEDSPKIYVLGDTGAGKSTVLQHILGTKKQSFPSTLMRRTTVAITEYIIDKSLSYASCFLLKSAVEVQASIEEIVEHSHSSIMKLLQKNKAVDSKDVIDNLGESPDQRFRLKYLINETNLNDYADRLIELSRKGVDSYQEEIEPPFIKTLADELFSQVQEKLKQASGLMLEAEQVTLLKEYDDKESCIESAKVFLKAGKESLSPLVSYARIQGGFGADWLPEESSFVIIDGEGIGHDIKESAILSARHQDYFRICDAIVLAEGAGKPFAAGGKSAIQGVIQNGYVDNFYLLMTKLDELIDDDDEESSDFEERIHDVRREFKNLEQALSSEGMNDDRWKNNVFYIEGLKGKDTPEQSVEQINHLLGTVIKRHDQVKAAAKMPEYDVEMLSAYLEEVSSKFHNEWSRLLIGTPWQSIKAFNRRMVWKHEEYSYLKPVAQLQSFIISELTPFLLEPKDWPTELSKEEKQTSIDTILKRFSSNVMAVVRDRVLTLIESKWSEGMALEGAGSTRKRNRVIGDAWDESVPHYHDEQAIMFKDQIKEALIAAMRAED